MTNDVSSAIYRSLLAKADVSERLGLTEEQQEQLTERRLQVLAAVYTNNPVQHEVENAVRLLREFYTTINAVTKSHATVSPLPAALWDYDAITHVAKKHGAPVISLASLKL